MEAPSKKVCFGTDRIGNHNFWGGNISRSLHPTESPPLLTVQSYFANHKELILAINQCLFEVKCHNNNDFAGGSGVWLANELVVCVELKDMSELFMDRGGFNEDISDWDVSSTINMYGMLGVLMHLMVTCRVGMRGPFFCASFCPANKRHRRRYRN